jgi:hypothetical protein
MLGEPPIAWSSTDRSWNDATLVNLGQIPMRAPYTVAHHFLPIWVLVLATVIGLSLRMHARSSKRPSAFPPPVAAPGHGPAVRLGWRPIDVAALLGFAAFFCAYAALMVWREDFAFPDDDIFTTSVLQGARIPFAIWPAAGRFFPLGHTEFNLLLPFGVTALRCHALVIGQLIVFCAAYSAWLSDFAIWRRFLVLAFLLLMPGFAIAFSGLIYPERNVAFWLALLVLSVIRYDRAGGRLNLVAALVVTQLALYYKEPVFVLVGVFAAVRLLGRMRGPWTARRTWTDVIGSSPLETGILLQCAAFVGLFVVVMLGREGQDYRSRASVGPIGALLHYTVIDLVFVIFAGIAVARVVRLVRRPSDFDRVWDPLAAGALAYAVLVILLGLSSDYYLLPLDIVAVPFVLRAVRPQGQRTPGARVAFVAAGLAVASVTATLGAYRLIERKNVVASTVALAEFLGSYRAEEVRLYLPYATTGSLVRVAAYLRYRGFPVLAAEQSNESKPPIVILSPVALEGDRCAGYRSYACRYQDRPRDGDLVALLPEDRHALPVTPGGGHAAELSPVFSYEPLAFPTSLRPLFARASVVSPWLDAEHPMPADWLHLRVFGDHRNE